MKILFPFFIGKANSVTVCNDYLMRSEYIAVANNALHICTSAVIITSQTQSVQGRGEGENARGRKKAGFSSNSFFIHICVCVSGSVGRQAGGRVDR